MSNVAKLKKQAAELELKKQFDKALAIYIKLLDSFDENASELDVALFNRVGDLLMRQGNVADAVDYYEKAVDHYADTGFFNNAIALCNKILRHSPGRASVYYKLGKISAQKGFKNDAKVNFLEYADRMQKAGKVDEAFRALKEFADLCPDQDEIRLMLADQLTKADRRSEAIEQLQTLHQRYDADGRVSEAAATAARMHAVDPSIEPRLAGGGTRKSTSGDLVFLDVDLPAPRVSGAYQRPATPLPSTPVRSPTVLPPLTPSTSLPLLDDPSASLPFLDDPSASLPLLEDRPTPTVGNRIPSSAESLPGIMQEPLSDVTRIGEENLGLEKSTPTSSLFGLESTNVMDDPPPSATPPSSQSLIDLEARSLETDDVHPVDRSSAPTHAMRDNSFADGDLDMVLPESKEPTPPASAPSIDFDLSMLTTPPLPTTARSHRPTPVTARTVLEGLPLMDLEIPPVTPVSSPRVRTPSDPVLLSSDLDLIDAAITGEAPPQIDDRRRDESAIGDDETIDFEPDSLMLDEEPIIVPTPSAARKSTMVAEHSVAMLKASVSAEPNNWSLHRELAEAMLDTGDRDGGIRELELAMAGAERSGDLDLASSLAEEIARLEPESVKHHQKRVEYAFRTNDRSRLIEAYVSLADALLRADQADKARTVYQRVLDLAPDDYRARAALDTIEVPEPEPPPPPPPQTQTQRRNSAAPSAPEPTKPVVKGGTAETFVNLGDWLRDSESPKDTRMVVDEQEPSGDEQADFADMLRKFKQGVAENVDAEDYQSHYDLAIAFKEMGLLDEAISEFQKALGSPTNRLPTYEALGQCFLDKGSFKLASSILGRALNEKGSEEQMLGVYYLLGRAAEAQGNTADALTYYQRVFVLDIQFRDTADRLNELERAPR